MEDNAFALAILGFVVGLIGLVLAIVYHAPLGVQLIPEFVAAFCFGFIIFMIRLVRRQDRR